MDGDSQREIDSTVRDTGQWLEEWTIKQFFSKVYPSWSKLAEGCLSKGLVYTMPDHFPESGTKNAPEYECLHDAWNIFITLTIFVAYFAYLPSNRSTSFALKPSCYQSEV